MRYLHTEAGVEEPGAGRFLLGLGSQVELEELVTFLLELEVCNLSAGQIRSWHCLAIFRRKRFGQ